MSEKLILPIGFMYNGVPVKQLDTSHLSGESELILTSKPKKKKVYTWMGQVVAVAVSNVVGESVSDGLAAKLKREPEFVPEPVLKIPQSELENQMVRCIHCGQVMRKVTIELDKIEVPVGEPVPVEFFDIDLKQDVEMFSESDIMAQYAGLKYNKIRVRVPTLADGIKAQHNVSTSGDESQEMNFWRDILFDCIVGFYYSDAAGNTIEMPEGYLTKRGKMLFSRDWSTKTNKHVRKALQTTLPSALFYYLDECTSCHEETPFYANSGAFFAS